MNSKESEPGFAMIRCCKRLKVGGGIPDRLTDLPINVKHKIQECLSVEEAARMSVLSRPWRHVWASIPTLLFRTQFCKNKQPDTLIDIINTVLLQHCGAIKTFLLHISSIPSSRQSVIDRWMFLLSENGIIDLNLQNPGNVPYKLPSYVFDVELERLTLVKCIFSPPCRFRGFHKLQRLRLKKVAFELDSATSSMWMPNLVTLQVAACSGLHHLKIYAPNLDHMYFSVSKTTETPELSQFMDCQKLDIVILSSNKVKDKITDKVRNLTNLLNCWPKLRNLSVGSYYLKCFASGTDTERLPICINSLRILSLQVFDFADEDHIFFLMRMLGSFPNLKDLVFMSNWVKKGGMEINEDHFEGSTYSTQGNFEGVSKLQKLRIDNFLGSRSELLFLRFILAAAPLLMKVTLLVDAESIDESQCLKISEEVMGFPSASPKLEIICRPLNEPWRTFY